MHTRLSDFILALSEDLELQHAYVRDPDAVMDAHGLSEGEKRALSTGDERVISRTVAHDFVFAKLIVAPKLEAQRALRKAA